MLENASTSPIPTNFRTRLNAQLHTFSSAFIYVTRVALPRRFNAVASSLRFNLFDFVRVQSTSSFNGSIALVIPTLLTYLQLKYQGQNETPFSTHPRTLRLAVSSTVIYFLVYNVLLRCPTCRFAVLAHQCLMWSGYSSVATLSSLLFPDFISPFVYAIFVLLSAAEFLKFLYHKLVVEEGVDVREYGRRIRRLFDDVRRVVAISFRKRSPIIPF